jgi:AraC-like DNA-binding protein
MLYLLDMAQMPSCVRFGRMLQQNHWNRQGTTEKSVNLLVYVISGSAVFTIGKTRYSINSGDALFVPANTPYSADTEYMCDYYFFHFDGDMIQLDNPEPYPRTERDFSFDLPQPAHKKITLKQKTETTDVYSKFYTCLTDCEDLHNSATFSGRLAMDNVLCRLLLMLSQIAEQQFFASGYPVVLDKMLGYIRKNLTQPIAIAEVCRYCGVSESYAARLFKKNLNTTMTQYITDQKLAYACELMHNTGMNMSQIAAYLGFCDVFYFSKRFKEKYGKSPTQMFVRK